MKEPEEVENSESAKQVTYELTETEAASTGPVWVCMVLNIYIVA